MHLKINTLIRKTCIFLFVFSLLITGQLANAQIYSHSFGTTTISTHPYTIAPDIFDSHLQNSSWSNSVSAWTSTTGATGEAIRITTATTATITLTFAVTTGFKADITAFDFWRLRSNLGPQNWTMAINGITVGSGTTATAGAALGNTPVSTAITGLTGTVTVTLTISNSAGNGTFRLDDFKLFGTVTSNCTAATISSFTPLSGPQNTLVTINGSGFQAGGGTTAVRFNGLAANGFTVISDTKIEAYLPAGNASGNVSVVTNGCEGFSPAAFTVIKTIAANNYSTDIYISELYDAQVGDGGVIEIYNGTASTVNLSGYTLTRAGDVGGPVNYTITLSGTIPPGGVYLIGIGTGVIPCGWTASQGQHYSTGFNANDEFMLYHSGTLIDDVQTPNNVGYSLIRNPNAIAPKTVFNGNDWNQNSSNTESCADIGVHHVTPVSVPVVTSPTSKSACESKNVSFTAPLSNPAGYSFQWKVLNSAGAWVNVSNGTPYTNATTNTLTINPVPANFNANQYYCQMTSGGNVLVSNAAQLAVTLALIPDFPTPLNICSGDAITIGNTSPNGVVGTWSSAFSNTIGATYTFTPSAGQCAVGQTLTIAVVPPKVANFPTPLNICSGDAITIGNTSPNGVAGTWSSAFSNTVGATYTFTPNAGQCAVGQTLTIAVAPPKVADFPTPLNICSGDVITVGNTSPNGVVGTWSSAFSNTVGATYTFTPSAGQCAVGQTLTIAIAPPKVANFPTPLNICSGDAITIGNTSPNGVAGTWSSAFSNTVGATYTFTPNAGQCAVGQTLTIAVAPPKVANFPTPLNICSGDAITIGNTSPNGVAGTWSSAFNNTVGATYTFTPNAGQCAVGQTLTIAVAPPKVADFPTPLNICSGDVITVGNTSPNGVVGTWSSAFSNTVGATYTFTPNAGQCAVGQTLTINITPPKIANFPTPLNICSGDAITIGNTSPNGVVGTWSSAFNNTVGATYTFTPNPGQCAVGQALTIAVAPPKVTDFPTPLNICSGDAITIGNTSPNGVVGTWSSAFSNTIGATYTFTPNAGQCAVGQTLTININPSKIANFPTPLNICSGDAITIGNTSPNGVVGTWSSAFSNTIGATYTFTPNAGQCAVGQTLTIAVAPPKVANFATPLNICSGDAITIGNTSPNGVIGTWSSAFSNTVGATYTFNPSTGQCAVGQTLTINITPPKIANFPTPLNICSGDAITIGNTSPNGVVGTWSSAFSNTIGATYTFTPNAGQCAVGQTLTIAVAPPKVANFPTPLNICSGDAITIGNTSPNGVVGTWSSAFSNTVGATYTFTPNSGQCAVGQTLTIAVVPPKVADFPTPLNICSGDAITIGNTSPNGVVGTWSSAFSNTVGATYTFTPNAGQCAVGQTLTIAIAPPKVADFPTPLNICSGDAITIGNTSPNGVVGTWSSAFSNTIGATYTFTPNAGQCAVGQTLTIAVAPPKVANFATPLNICSGDAITIGNTSPNGVVGTWSSAFSNTVGATYSFTPNAGQCAVGQTLTIAVAPPKVANFPTPLNICSGDVITIGNTSPNGVVGTWSSAFSNTVGATYTFTPNAGQCAVGQTLTININPSKIANFPTPLNICSGDAITIGNTSPNGVVGTWSSAFSNTIGATYTFTPNAGQCAVGQTLTIAVAPPKVANFATPLNICSGDAITIGNTSPNGVVGTWSSVFNNTVGATYTFTPNAGQCAIGQTLTINITPPKIADFPTPLNICSGDAITIGNTSPNGVVGTWSSAFSNTVGATYTFTPNAGQCAVGQTFTIAIAPPKVADFPTPLNICSGDAITIGNTSPNGVIGTWSSAFSNTVGAIYTFTPSTGQCAVGQTLTIAVAPPKIADFPTPLNICSGDAITIGNTSPNGVVGTWSSAFSNTVGATYTFIPSVGQCAVGQTLTIAVKILSLSAIVGPSQVCEGTSISLSNAVLGGIWASDNTAIAMIDAAGTVSGIAAGTANLSYTIASGSCSLTVFHTVNVHPLPKPKLTDQNFCIDGKTGLFISDIILNCGIPNSGYSFVWTRNGLPLLTTGNSHVANEAGIYEVVVTNTATGCSQTAQCTLGISAIPTGTAIATEDFQNNQIITVTVSPVSNSYLFRLNGGPWQQSPVFSIASEGENIVETTDTKGCGTLTLPVYVLNYPRFFTPNGDGYNDTWNVRLPDENGSMIYIFDRMGKLLKSLKPSKDSGWDGTFNGKMLPASDYWFQLHYRDYQGGEKEFKAHFSLKR